MGQHTRKVNQRQPNGIRRFMGTPKGTLLYLLIGIALVAALHPSDHHGLATVSIAIVTGVAFDFCVGVVIRHRASLSTGGMLTGLIVGLVLGSTAAWWVVVATTVLALLSKHVLKSGRKPWFNPAAVGLLVSVFVFSTGESWWGDFSNLPTWCIPLLLLAGFVVVRKTNKFPQVVSFLGVYLGLITLAGLFHLGHSAFSPGDALRNPLINSALFMAFFMLTDPPTSPGKYSEQVWFGMLCALVSVCVYLLFGGLAYLLVGLLVANGWRAWKSKRTRKAPETQVRNRHVAV